MSRREDRDSDSKRHRSKFDQQPSPKRSRRDGKPATERPSTNLDLDLDDRSERDQKHRPRLQDALPLEAPPAPEAKAETGVGSKENDKKTNGQDRSKNSSRPTEVSRSRSLNQHDERVSARQAGRTTGREDTSDRRSWRDSKDKHGDRAEKVATDDTEHRHDRSRTRRDDYPVRHHDRFSDRESNRQTSSRKRPPFTEKKTALDSEKVDKTEKTDDKAGAEEAVDKVKHPDRPLVGNDRRDDKGGHNHRYSERPDKRLLGDRHGGGGGNYRAKEGFNGSFQSRDRHGGGGGVGGGNFRAKEGFNGRRAYPPPPAGGGGGGDKWKHDLYEEANKSPPRKNEDDRIAKIEALLSS